MAGVSRPRDTEVDQVDDWEHMWQKGILPFHRERVHQCLLQHFQKVTDGEKELSFLVPLCGKSVDLKWLADHGFKVTGIEVVTKACEDFFSEQGVKHVLSGIPNIPGGKLFESEDGKIKIYNTDIWNLDKDTLGQFDVVWDRGSMVAICFADRSRYIDLMKSVIKPGGKILLEAFEYDWNERKKKGSPRPLMKEEVQKFYGDWCTFEEVDRIDWLKGNLQRNQRLLGISVLECVQYLLQVAP